MLLNEKEVSELLENAWKLSGTKKQATVRVALTLERLAHDRLPHSATSLQVAKQKLHAIVDAEDRLEAAQKSRPRTFQTPGMLALKTCATRSRRRHRKLHGTTGRTYYDELLAREFARAEAPLGSLPDIRARVAKKRVSAVDGELPLTELARARTAEFAANLQSGARTFKPARDKGPQRHIAPEASAADELIREIEKVITSLPPEECEVIAATDFGGKTLTEYTLEKGISISMAQRRRDAGRLKLADQFGGEVSELLRHFDSEKPAAPLSFKLKGPPDLIVDHGAWLKTKVATLPIKVRDAIASEIRVKTGEARTLFEAFRDAKEGQHDKPPAAGFTHSKTSIGFKAVVGDSWEDTAMFITKRPNDRKFSSTPFDARPIDDRFRKVLAREQGSSTPAS